MIYNNNGRVIDLGKCDIEEMFAKKSRREFSLRQALEKKRHENAIRGTSTQIAKVAPFIVYKGKYGTLNLVDCEVTVIDDISSSADDISSMFHRGPICTLYLSNNLISSLGGIEQDVFLTITKLSLTNNDIRNINDLQPLSKLPKLNTLSLHGNPVTHLPYYKQEVLTICTGLISLDGVNINSPADFLIAQSCIYKYRDRRKSIADVEIKKYILTRWLQLSPVLAEIRSSQQKLRYKPVLTVAVAGGLGSWMQIMSGEHFELQVQTLLNQKGMRRKKRSKFSTRPDSDKSDEEKGLAAVHVRSDVERWDDFVSEFAKHQSQQLLDLEERCCEAMGNQKSVSQQGNTRTLNRSEHTILGNELKEENDRGSAVRHSYDKQALNDTNAAQSLSHSNSLPILALEKKIKQPLLPLRTSSDKENILETASVSSKTSTSTAKVRSAEVNYEILQEKMLLLKKKQIQRQQEIQDRYIELLQTHLRTEEKRSRSVVRVATKAKDRHGNDGDSSSSAQSLLHWKDQAKTKTRSTSSDRLHPLLLQSNIPLSVESTRIVQQASIETPGVSLFESNTTSFGLNSLVLPVQQCEPEDLDEKYLNEQHHPFLDYVQSFTTRASHRLAVTCETTKDDPRVLEPWVSLGEEIAGFLQGISSDFIAYKSSADKVNLDLFTQQQAQPSMRELKVDVQRAIQEQSLLQRQEFVGRDINSILQASLQEFQDKCQTMYSSFLESVSEGSSGQEDNDLISTTKKLRKEITSVASDIAQCERDNWMDHARSIASSYEDLQKEAAIAKQSLRDAEARLQLIDSALADGQDVQERLLNSNSEVKRALGDIHGYIRNSSDLQHLLIVFARIMKSSTMDLESASLMSRTLMKKSFDKLVLSTYSSVRLKQAEAHILEETARRTYLSFFRRWHRAFQLENICSRFIKKRIISMKRLFYSLWTSRVCHSHQLKRHLNQHRLLSVTRSLKDWKVFAVRSRIEKRRSAQHDLCVRLYLTLKAFRGWKSFVTSSMASLQRTFLEVWKKKSNWVLLGAWKVWKLAFESILMIHPIAQADTVVEREVTTSQRRQLLVSLNDMLVTSRLRICWRRWTALYNFRVLLCLYRAKKRGLQLFLKSLRELKHRNTKNIKCFHTAIEWRNKRRLRRLSLFISFLKRRRQKGIIRQKRIQAVLTSRRLKSAFLKWLKAFLLRVGQNVSKYTESIPLILKKGRSGLDAVLVAPGRRAAQKEAVRGVATNSSVYREEKEKRLLPHKPPTGQEQVPVFYLNVGRFHRQSVEHLKARTLGQPKAEQSAMLESLEMKVQTLSSTRILRRCFQILLHEFLGSHLQQFKRHAELTERCQQIEDSKKVGTKGNSSSNSSRRLAVDALSSTPSQFCESSNLAAEKLKNLDNQIAEFLRDKVFITNGMRDLEGEEDQVLAATKLREETDNLQTELTDLESQIHYVDLTRADLQASVNALEHSADDARKKLEEYASEGLLFHELQHRLAVLSQESHLVHRLGSSLSSAAVGEGLDQLRNMEDLYQEAVTSLSAAAGNMDQVDDILSTRKVRLDALRSQLQERDILCEEMRQQKKLSQQKAQDVARAVEDTLRKMAAQALDYDQQIAALDAESAEAERDQRDLLAAEQRLRAFQEHRHALMDSQVRKQPISLEQGTSMPNLVTTQESSVSAHKIQLATPLPNVSARSDSYEGTTILPSIPFTTPRVRSYDSVVYDSTDDELGGRIRAVTARIRDRLNSAI